MVKIQLRTELALPERCLKVKNLTFVFDPVLTLLYWMMCRMQFWSASSLNLSGRFAKNDMTNLWSVKATVYGKREGFLPGSWDPHAAKTRHGEAWNRFLACIKHYKLSCPHPAIFPSTWPDKASPQKSTSLPHMGRAFTDVQEQKQAPCHKFMYWYIQFKYIPIFYWMPHGVNMQMMS